MANYREPQWLLPNEKNLAMPASDATVGSGLAEDRHSLYSMDFDGSNDEIVTSFLGTGQTEITVSAWINSDSIGADQTIFGTVWAASTACVFDVDSTGKLRLFFRSGSTNPGFLVANTILSASTWYHAAVTLTPNGTNMDCTFYLNGVIDNTTGATQAYGQGDTAIASSGTGYNIGSTALYSGSNYNFFNGKIDEVAIFTRSLSSSEITTIYNSGVPGNLMALSDKPVVYYPLGEQARRGSEWQFPNEVLQSQVFDFDGSTDYIDCGNPTELQITGALTISAWVKFTGGSDMALVTKSNTSGTERSYGIWAIRSGSPQTPVFFIYSSGIAYLTPDTGTTVRDGNWHHLVGVFNPSTSLQLYIDGVLEQENTTSIPATIDNDVVDFNIGRAANGTFYYNGEISNVAIWNSDQSANIANIYNNGSPQSSYTTTPTAWYKLNATSNYAGLNPNWHDVLDFGGTDYIDCGIISAVEGVSTFSMAAWVYPTNGAIKTVIGNWGNPYIGVNIETSSSAVYFNVDSDAAGSGYGASSSGLTNNTWNHVMLVFDGSGSTNSDKLKGYINGVEQSLSYTGTIPSTTATPNRSFRIGDAHAGNGLIGNISNAAIWNQVISSEDVKYLYNGGTPQTNISFEPVSWWKLDNLTTGIQDSGSASNNGTNNGATEVASNVAVDQWNFDNVSQAQTPNYSSALDFDGSDYIQIPYNANLTPQTGNFSISAWINTDDLSGWHPIWSTLNLDSSVAAVALHTFDTKIRVTIGRPTSGWALLLDSTATLSTDTWYHIAVTFDFSGNAQIYINGNADNSGAIGTHSTTWHTGDRYIGEGEGLWDGRVSNLSIYSSELSAAQITTLYNSGTPETAISLSPVSWWKLDNTTTGIQDSGSASNNGTNNGATEIQTNVWTPRLNGESTTLPSTALVSSDLQFESPYSNFSLDFDGTNDYINCSVNSSLVSATNFSLSGWFYFDSVANNKTLYSYGGATGTNQYSITAQTHASGNLIFVIADAVTDAGNNYIQTNLASVLTTSTWYHIVCTYDGSQAGNTDKAKIYINGTEVAYAAGLGTIPATTSASTGPFNIGQWELGGSNRFFNGKIDEIAIFSSTLTQAQISQVYNNGYPADLTSLSPVSWWRLGEDAYFVSPNFTVPNQITGAPNGTSQNMDQADLVADAPGSYASGVGSSLALADRVGDAPESTANSLSFNMTPLNKISYPAGYVPTQADNIYSMAFDGASTKITFPTITLATNYTLSAWAKRSSTANMFLFGNSQTYGYGAYFNGTSNLYFKESFLMTFNNAAIQTALARTDWVHWVFVKDTTTGTVSIYVDGVLAQSVSGSGMATINAIGGSGRPTGTQYIWNGNIDEVAIFDYALSARQIKQDIYNGTTTGKTADLNNISNLTAPVAWYRMGD